MKRCVCSSCLRRRAAVRDYRHGIAVVIVTSVAFLALVVAGLWSIAP